MDSTISVALATKMLQLFPATDTTGLSFPVAGEAFTASELDIFHRPNESADDIRRRSGNKAQFARLLNRVPDDDQRWACDGRVLWTEFKAVLDDATVADTALSASDQSRLRAARDYLTDTVDGEGGPGSEVYSAAVTAYYTYKDAHDEAERTWLDERSTAENSGDVALLQAWESGRRQQVEAALAKATQDWLTLGHKAEVEDAQATVASLAGRSPQVRRTTLLADYELCVEPDLASNDPVGVLSTFYSPSDAFSAATPWTTLSIAGAEIGMLLAQAPEALRAGVAGSTDGVRSVTLEYADVAVVRPWFDPSFLAARTWKLTDGTVVSDGGTPRTGRIPAYVTGMVVARKVTVVRDAPAAPTSDAPTWKDLGRWFDRVDRLDRRMVRRGPGGMKRFDVESSVAVLAPHVLRRPDVVGPVAPAAGPARPATPEPVIGLSPARVAGLTTLRRVDAPGGVLVNGGTPVIIRPPILFPPPPPPPPPPSPTTVTEEMVLDGVIVLAYRLRRVPLSPDPDLTLPWDGRPAPTPDPVLDPHPFPLPSGHVLGRRKSGTVHDGTASASDRVIVMTLQTQLKKSLPGVGIDGVFGPKTEGFVAQFQRSKSLTPDGVVGPATWRALW